MAQITLQQALGAAIAHHQAGRMSDAEALYRKIIALQPNHADANHLLGVLMGQRGAHAAAVELMQRAIAADASNARYYFNLSVAYADLGKLHHAIETCRRGLELEPNNADVINTLGTHLRETGQLIEAVATYRRAIDLHPAADFHNNLAMALCENGEYDEAMRMVSRALELRADFPEAHWSLAFMLLISGDFERGWREYEWRWRMKGFDSIRRDNRTQWDGSDLKGKTILLYGEQGFGDAIQFVRYAPLLAQRGAIVKVQSRPELSRLFRSIPGITSWPVREPDPVFDVHFPLLSLPLALGTRVDSIPADIPYLRADPALVEAWGHRVNATTSGSSERRMKVGLAWAGSATHRRDRDRSMALEQLAPLAQVSGIDFYSLQKGHAAGQTGMTLIDVTPDLHDFADTAALMANLDLILCVDTAVAHLAGAMGKSVWVMLPLQPDWRWQLDREDTPWYPTMGLFRQGHRGDWKEVVERVAQELDAYPARLQ